MMKSIKNEHECQTGELEMEKRRNKTDKLSHILIILGLFIIASIVAWEAYRYPWATVFGGSQSDSALSDPPPISWENEAQESSSTGSSAYSFTPSSAILPGSEAPKEAKHIQYTELGIIKIPKLSLSQHVLEGAQDQMHYGVGHVTGTAAIGGSGNCALAGHNTTSFRYLDKLSTGDSVILKADGNVFTYSVIKSFVVLPSEVSVLKSVPGENALLTLITCTPYLTGTHRLIVQARLTEINGTPPSSGPEPGYEADSGLVPTDSAVPSTDSSMVLPN